jgi:hypothetical protein
LGSREFFHRNPTTRHFVRRDLRASDGDSYQHGDRNQHRNADQHRSSADAYRNGRCRHSPTRFER